MLGTGQRLAWIKALFDPLVPLETLEGPRQGLRVEDRELEAKLHFRV